VSPKSLTSGDIRDLIFFYSLAEYFTLCLSEFVSSSCLSKKHGAAVFPSYLKKKLETAL